MSIRFSFDGRIYHGEPGDILASALLANGMRLMGCSFKYHRPRGPLAAGSEEPNALVEVDRGGGARTPNLRATQVEIYDGLVARSQNRFPSVGFNLQAVNDVAAPVLSAGFCYKTFMAPEGAWARLYEPLLRRAAGLGRAPDAPDPDHYASRYAHCDVLVIGSGPAGIAAAGAASEAGARVILCDEQPRFGGSLLSDRSAQIDGMTVPAWVAAQIGALAARPDVALLTRTTAFGWYPDNMIGLAQWLTDHLPNPDPALPRERLWQVRAKQVVIAAGAIERPLVFPGNDRPDVMLADAARTYAVRGLEDALLDGATAGSAAAHDAGFDASAPARRRIEGAMSARWTALAAPCRKQRRAFVDFQNDVTSKDLLLATQEGFHSIEHVKRYTTTGMATDQGKTSNMNALSIVAAELGRPVPAVGLTTFRPPHTPVTFGTLAAYSRGAVFEDVSLWKRPFLPVCVRGHARGRRAGMPHGARRRGPVRHLDAWQDRGRGAGRGRVHEPDVRERLDQAGTRPLPLRADAERERLPIK